jgi:hypothetical protein
MVLVRKVTSLHIYFYLRIDGFYGFTDSKKVVRIRQSVKSVNPWIKLVIHFIHH